MSPRVRSLSGSALLAGGMSIMALTGGLRVHTLRYLILYAIAAAGYLLLVGGRRGTLSVRAIVLLGLALRLLFLAQAPTLSDDYYRYLWDGRVQLAGINPYLYPPDDPHLDGVPFQERALINHQTVNTIYPASAQLLFWGVARAGIHLAPGLKLVLGAFELLTAWLVWRLAGAWRERALAVYLLNPLVIQETWSSAHVEAAAVCLAVLAAVFVVRRRDLLAGVALGFAAGVKLTPAVLLIPALVGRRARPIPLLAGFAAGFALPYIPYALSGALLGSLSQTGAKPQFNDGGFALLSLMMPYGVARVVAAALFVVGAVLVSRRLPGRERTAAAFAWTATLFLFLLPVVYPWYWLTAVALGAAGQVRLPTLLGLFSPASYAAYAPMLSGRRTLMRAVAWLPLLTAPRELRQLWRPTALEPAAPDPPDPPMPIMEA